MKRKKLKEDMEAVRRDFLTQKIDAFEWDIYKDRLDVVVIVKGRLHKSALNLKEDYGEKPQNLVYLLLGGLLTKWKKEERIKYNEEILFPLSGRRIKRVNNKRIIIKE